jgi:hypothetical protein
MSIVIRAVAGLAFAITAAVGFAGCDTSDPYQFCRGESEPFSPSPIITRAYVFSSKNDVFCKAAIQQHNHYHCLQANMNTHEHLRGWSVCPDNTAGPGW